MRSFGLVVLAFGVAASSLAWIHRKLFQRRPPDPLKSPRAHLAHVSFCETGQSSRQIGVPAGALLVPLAFAERLKRMLEAAVPGTKLKKVHPMPHDPDTLVLHLPCNAAHALDAGAVPAALTSFAHEHQASHTAAVSLAEHAEQVEYYPGVRICDPAFCASPPLFSRAAPATTEASGSFTYAELFAGIGGFRAGIEPLGGQCVFASEIDSAARATYQANFDEQPAGDITDIYSDQIPPFDLLTAGFPCQAFSCRGDQGGLGDARAGRGQMFRCHHHETNMEPVVLRAHSMTHGFLQRALQNLDTETTQGNDSMAILNPNDSLLAQAFLFENVAAMATMDGGRRNRRSESVDQMVIGQTLQTILKEFRSCGYDVNWRIVNSRHWLPQMRERLYFVGFRLDLQAQQLEWQTLIGSAAGMGSTVRDILEPPDSTAIVRATLSHEQWDKVIAHGGLPA